MLNIIYKFLKNGSSLHGLNYSTEKSNNIYMVRFKKGSDGSYLVYLLIFDCWEKYTLYAKHFYIVYLDLDLINFIDNSIVRLRISKLNLSKVFGLR